MAPKRKKPGQTRMDAALDHICKMGFSRPLVRKTVKDLLKVYGEDGWMLIEEDAYKVLLDYILDEQEAAQTTNLLKDASSSKVASEEVSIQENAIASLTHNAVSNENALSSLNHNVESSEVPLLTMQGPVTQKCSKDADSDKNALPFIPFHDGDDHSANEIALQSSENTSLSLRICDEVHAPLNIYTSTHKPCYGWISDDEDDDDNTKLIELAPAT
ncbi:putative [histone H3]-lysine(4) N-trimethyltransferase [Helianthus annuus]|nr:putative [histone H3]-lysine(4) N-trimethyltransferase [Helianthus annuus]